MVAPLVDALPGPGADPADLLDAFATWAAASGRPLYPHQEDACLALAEGDHVVLATPTGSGKSLVAVFGVVQAVWRGERAVWTAPIKALVAEKFFDLVALLGAERVGLATGDAAINADAPVLVCTAEVLANQALRDGDRSPFGFACLDEFHYYGERDRGWAWQVPLLTMRGTQFLAASATLGDMAAIGDDLEDRSGRRVTEVTSVERPTPLFHQWRMTPVAESVADAVRAGLAPVYVVHSTQAAAVERAQALSSLPLSTRDQREAIAAALVGTRLSTGFGQALARYLRNGIGVHHAGMLPRYRRLVERLAGDGLLPVVCGTDTLGVGVNIPIRTVLLTGLTKFDGDRVRVLSAREFHQVAGRAGRPGHDPDGHVWAQAPEHVIDNERALARAGDDPKARRKVQRAAPPKGFVHYDESTFDRLIAARPEPLVSRFKVTPDLVATVLARPDGPAALKDLLRTNHDPEPRRRAHMRRAIHVYRSLEAAGVAERVRDASGRCAGVRVGALTDGDERNPLRMSSPLAPFAIEVIATFDADDPAYALDVVTVIESVLDDPMPVLLAQRNAARAAEVARLKAEGVPYEERYDRVGEVTWPQPLADVLAACFATYRAAHPWVDEEPSSKSIVREMLETGEGFAGYVHRYGLERSEGLLLRHLTDTWRALDRSLPDDAYTDMLEDVIGWLGELIRATDASLLEEWERLAGAPVHERAEPDRPVAAGPPRAWRTAARTALFGWVELLARRAHDALAARTGWPPERLAEAMAGYWADHGSLGTDADARSAAFFDLVEEPGRWALVQRLADPAGDHDWRLLATVDLAESEDAGVPVVRLVAVGRFGEELVALPAARGR